MPIEMTMPRLSDTMQQGTIVKWNVKEGQKVKSGDVVADIETDKATMELQSFDDGTVARLAVAEGQAVPVGTLIMVLAGAGESVDAARSAGGAGAGKGGAAKDAPASSGKRASVEGEHGMSRPAGTSTTAVIERSDASRQTSGTQANGRHGAPSAGGFDGHGGGGSGRGGRVFASPLAKKIAEESGVDLSGLQGSGPGGRIIRRDVEDAMSSGGGGRGAAGHTQQIEPKRSTPAPVPAAGATLEGRTVPLSNMRRVIASRLQESKQTIPHYQVTVDVDMDALMSLRGQLNEQLAGQGVKLSVNDFLVKAVALAMHQHPYVNSRWNGGTGLPTGAGGKTGQETGPTIEIISDVNVGIAIALSEERGGGLLVATLRNADNLGLRQISAQSKQLADKARSKGLSPQEMSDSTFTISNLGMFGVSHFNAIINPPNVAILAVGAAVQKPVVKNGQVVPGYVMSMTMSSDHRVVDGAMAAAYLATVRELLEKPATLLV
ncbi:MAG TPA: dihydrolipoamide acetyltransferase family protein [Phycisphaerales bacterium]|nr:dihydrolipoamide acetyltransferase family protein [Phycisphaerales bacterium]